MYSTSDMRVRDLRAIVGNDGEDGPSRHNVSQERLATTASQQFSEHTAACLQQVCVRMLCGRWVVKLSEACGAMADLARSEGTLADRDGEHR